MRQFPPAIMQHTHPSQGDIPSPLTNTNISYFQLECSKRCKPFIFKIWWAFLPLSSYPFSSKLFREFHIRIAQILYNLFSGFCIMYIRFWGFSNSMDFLQLTLIHFTFCTLIFQHLNHFKSCNNITWTIGIHIQKVLANKWHNYINWRIYFLKSTINIEQKSRHVAIIWQLLLIVFLSLISLKTNRHFTYHPIGAIMSRTESNNNLFFH